VAGRLHVEPLQRIGFLAGAGLVEVVGGIGELRGEFGDEVGGDFVAARADRGADGGKEIGRLAAEFKLHAADGFLSDSGQSAAPARVNGGNRAFFRIDEEDRRAIGGLDGEEQAGTVCGRSVAFASVGWGSRENADHVRVDLLEGNEREIRGTESGLKLAAIFEHVLASVPFHEPEIQDFFGFERAYAAGTRAEAVDEPGQLAEGGEFENLQSTSFAEPPRLSDTWDNWHRGRGLTRATTLQRRFSGSHNQTSIIATAGRVKIGERQ
jgi:hypothetical protein